MKIHIGLKGTRPILFDRYAGSNKEQLPWEKKIYLSSDGQTLIYPALNIMSFLSAKNTESAPKAILGKAWGSVAKAAQSCIQIDQFEIPFCKDGKPLNVANAGLTAYESKAIIKKAGMCIPNPITRPMLQAPWTLEFDLNLRNNPDLTEGTLRRLFTEGGAAVGFGSFRPFFGQFIVEKWVAK